MNDDKEIKSELESGAIALNECAQTLLAGACLSEDRKLFYAGVLWAAVHMMKTELGYADMLEVLATVFNVAYQNDGVFERESRH